MPKISVIVPVYNTEKYLAQCIDSVLAQTFTDFELLLINDGSKDNSGAICDQFAVKDSRVTVFHKENGGVSSARNLGLENARGEWVAFVDSDDWIAKTMYQEMYELAKFENADIVYCDINMVFTSSQKVWKAAIQDRNKVEFLNNYLVSEWTSLCNLLVKKSLFDSNLIKNPEEYQFAEDFHVSSRLMYYAEHISYLSKPLYNYNRMNVSSAMHNLSTDHYDKERMLNLDLIHFFINERVYEDYARSLNWRMLKSLQSLVLDSSKHDKFMAIHPDCHNYIWDCPYLNIKIKIMMWSLAHHLRVITLLFLCARNIKSNIIKKWCSNNCLL